MGGNGRKATVRSFLIEKQKWLLEQGELSLSLRILSRRRMSSCQNCCSYLWHYTDRALSRGLCGWFDSVMKLFAHLQFHITTCSYCSKNYCTQYYSLGVETSEITYFYTPWIAKNTKWWIIEHIHPEFSLKAQRPGSNYLMLVINLCIDGEQVFMMAEWSYKTLQEKCSDWMQLKMLVLNLKILNDLRTWTSKEPFLPL